MPPLCTGRLTQRECDELEFEGIAAAGNMTLPQTELLVAACLVGLTALALVWKRLRCLPFIGAGRERWRQRNHQLASPQPPTPDPPQRTTPERAPTSPAAARVPPTPPSRPPRSLSPNPTSPRSAPSSLTPTFSLTPGWKSLRRRGSGAGSLLRAPSGLLRHLAALGQQLGLPQRGGSPLWFLGGSRAAGAAQAGAPGAHASPAKHYGLGLGEAESADDESEDDLTARELRALQQSPEFKVFLRSRGLDTNHVARTSSRLRLYRKLRELDPLGFWLLCRAGTTRSFETQDASRLTLAWEYVLSLAASLAAAGALYSAWACPCLAAPTECAACVALAWWLTGAAWVQGRSAGGRVLGLWYEELRWGHGVAPWRAAAAALLELLYVCGTGGLGAGVSLALRCLRHAGRQQSVGEMCAGVRLVREVVVLQNQVVVAGGEGAGPKQAAS